MLKGSFVSEEGIRLQLFVPVSPRPGGLDVKGWGTLRGQDCRSRKLAPPFLHPANLLCEYSRVFPALFQCQGCCLWLHLLLGSQWKFKILGRWQKKHFWACNDSANSFCPRNPFLVAFTMFCDSIAISLSLSPSSASADALYRTKSSRLCRSSCRWPPPHMPWRWRS